MISDLIRILRYFEAGIIPKIHLFFNILSQISMPESPAIYIWLNYCNCEWCAIRWQYKATLSYSYNRYIFVHILYLKYYLDLCSKP